MIRNCLTNPNTSGITPSKIDKTHFELLRTNIDKFIKSINNHITDGSLLDIGPQNHNVIKNNVDLTNVKYFSCDIVDTYSPDYIIDMTKDNSNKIKNNTFDYVICTEVLEHTENPFLVIKEINRILKHNGLVFISVPLNFRIHGPLPDAFRITEHGLKLLLKNFELIELNALETPDRPLFPIHYTVIAKKKNI